MSPLSRFGVSFNMKIIPLAIALSLGLTITMLHASNPILPVDADMQWKQISSGWHINSGSSGAPENKALLATSRVQQLLDIASRAHDFAETNPSHPHARNAKKIEALSTLLAADAGATEKEPIALRLGLAFRNDRSNNENDRYEVASATVDYNLRKKNLAAGEMMGEYEKKADTLVAEFPQNAELYRTYIGVMRVSTPARARAVALKVLTTAAPAEVKADAQFILDRLDLIGTKPALEFPTTDGKTFRLDDQAGKVVVIYIWTAQSPAFASVFDTARGFGGRATLVGLNVDQDIERAAAASEKFNAPGAQYADARGLKSPLASWLKVQDVPSFYVFSRDGRLAGIGGFNELPNLMSAAAE